MCQDARNRHSEHFPLLISVVIYFVTQEDAV